MYVIYNPEKERYYDGSLSAGNPMWKQLPENALIYESEERAEEDARGSWEVMNIDDAIDRERKVRKRKVVEQFEANGRKFRRITMESGKQRHQKLHIGNGNWYGVRKEIAEIIDQVLDEGRQSLDREVDESDFRLASEREEHESQYTMRA